MDRLPQDHGHDGTDAVDALAERLMTGAAVAPALSSVAAPRHRAAVLTALSARYLLAPGVVTASVVGGGWAVRAQLDAVARHVPGTSHVAGRGGAGGAPGPRPGGPRPGYRQGGCLGAPPGGGVLGGQH
ncbi:hypothetical protein ACFV4N_20290, partial [Actinosynnema sp. NPDC059797]